MNPDDTMAEDKLKHALFDAYCGTMGDEYGEEAVANIWPDLEAYIAAQKSELLKGIRETITNALDAENPFKSVVERGTFDTGRYEVANAVTAVLDGYEREGNV